MFSLEKPNQSFRSDEVGNSSRTEKRAPGRTSFKIISRWMKGYSEILPGRKKGKTTVGDKELTLLLQNVRGIRSYTYIELRYATDKFSSELLIYEDKFHSLFNAHLRDECLDALIKRMKCFEGLDIWDLFIMELRALAILKHPNIVKCIGWCHQPDHFLVVHESKFIGPLYSCLRSSDNLLPWNVRYKISIDLASAILYLHEERDCFHRNITSKNVLLASDFNAKLTCFMFAKLPHHGIEEEKVAQILEISPEHLRRGIITKASDIHHFGIIVLELATGLDPAKIQDILLRSSLRHMIKPDERLEGKFDVLQLTRLIEVGLQCALPSSQPCLSMKNVIRYLQQTEDECKTMPGDMTYPPLSSSSSNIWVPLTNDDDLWDVVPSQLQQSVSRSFDMEQQLPYNLNSGYCGPLTIKKRKQEMNSGNLHENQIIEEHTPVDLDLILPNEPFDIGIPDYYNSAEPLTDSNREMMKSFASSLHDKLKVTIQFDKVLEIISSFTSALVSLNVPLKQWNSFAQYVLCEVKKIEYLGTRYNEQVQKQTPRTLLFLQEEIKGYDVEIKDEDSTIQMHASLMRELEECEKEIVELQRELLDTEATCRLLKCKIESKKRKREENFQRSEKYKAQVNIWKNLLSRLSSFSLDD